MIRRRGAIEVFSLSFLDVIACAFGAVVMLILLAKGGDEEYFNTAEMMASLTRGLAQAGLENDTLRAKLEVAAASADAAANDSAQAAAELARLQGDVARSKKVLAKLILEAKQEDLKRQPPPQTEVAATRAGTRTERDEEVGGIPVDSEYVVFIVDTSGSMKRIWSLVMSNLTEVLNNHPKVKGFQVISDRGEYMFRATKGRWLTDNAQSRRDVLAQMQSWSGGSQSSPVGGIQEALRRYGNQAGSLALYVFGDDFTGASFDQALASINRLNGPAGQKRARIHALAFNSNSGAREMLKFSQLMREVTTQNNGTFLTAN